MHNSITQIHNQQEERLEEHDDIERELLKHFKNIHQEPQINIQPAIEWILQHIPKIITEEHNQLLLHLVTLQEVESTMNQLKEGKAPRPDGFTSNFFHKFLDLIKADVWKVVEEYRTFHWLFPSLNATFIALIPKEEHSITLEKFRPIALCNVIYKVISKVIAS